MLEFREDGHLYGAVGPAPELAVGQPLKMMGTFEVRTDAVRVAYAKEVQPIEEPGRGITTAYGVQYFNILVSGDNLTLTFDHVLSARMGASIHFTRRSP